MDDFDSGIFQANDDVGFCFMQRRRSQTWKDKVLKNVKNIKVHTIDIKSTFEYLLTKTELWDIPWNDFSGTMEEYDYKRWWDNLKNDWVKETLERAEPYYDKFIEWDDIPDEEHHVRVMTYLLNIDNIW